MTKARSTCSLAIHSAQRKPKILWLSPYAPAREPSAQRRAREDAHCTALQANISLHVHTGCGARDGIMGSQTFFEAAFGVGAGAYVLAFAGCVYGSASAQARLGVSLLACASPRGAELL